MLDRLRIAREQVVSRSELSRIDADQLVLPIRQKSADVLPMWLARAVREELPWGGAPSGPARRLLVSRSDAPARRIANEAELLSRLEPHGFEQVALTGMSFAAQQQLFASARTIVAGSGAGLTNLLWCRPGTRVIEIVTHGLRTPVFPLLARQLQLDHVVVPSGMETRQCVDHHLPPQTLDTIAAIAVR